MFFLLALVLLAVLFYYIFNYLEGNLPSQVGYKAQVWDFGTFQPKVMIVGDKLLVHLFGMIVAARPLRNMERIDYETVTERTARLIIGAPTYIGTSIWVPKIKRSEELVEDINGYIEEFKK